MKVIILRGLPASGKSTFAKKWVLEDPTQRIIVNRDSIRHMFGKYWVPQREELVSEIERQTIFAALYKGYDVVIDATNFNNMIFNYLRSVRKLLSTIQELEIIIKDFTNTPIDLCIYRDSLRSEQVGEKVILNMAKKYLNYGKSYRGFKNR